MLYVFIADIIWSTGGLFIKLTTLDAYQVTFFRSLLACVTVAILTRKQGFRINAFGVLTSIIYATLLFLFVWATKKTTAANAIFLQYTAPIYILILAPFLIGEKFHWRDLITVVFCIAGMSLFFVGKLEISDYQGNIAALLSGVFLGLYIMLLKHPAAEGSRQEAEGSWQKAESSASQLPTSAAILSERGAVATGSTTDLSEPRAVATGSPVDPDALSNLSNGPRSTNPKSEIPNPKSSNPAVAVIYGNLLLAILCATSGVSALPIMTSTDWFAVSFLGIIQIGISYVLFIKGVTGGTRPLDASIIGFIEPILNPVWVFFFLGERPSSWALLGGGVIIATVITHTVVQYRGEPKYAA